MISHDIIDVKKYYENFIQLFNDVLLNNLSKQFDKSIYLYLKFSLEPVKNLLLVSNVLSHLFTCPKSNYAKNDCSFCSRLLFNRLFCPSNAIELQYDYLSIDIFFVDDVKKHLKNILLIESGLIFVFDHLNIIKLVILMKKDVC